MDNPPCLEQTIYSRVEGMDEVFTIACSIRCSMADNSSVVISSLQMKLRYIIYCSALPSPPCCFVLTVVTFSF